MTEESSPSPSPKQEGLPKAAPKTNFKSDARVSPSVSFDKTLFGTAKPPQDLLFGRLSQPENFQYETATLAPSSAVSQDSGETAVNVQPIASPAVPSAAINSEPHTNSAVAWILAVMLFLVGAAGSPGVAPLADTVKSAVVAILAVAALAVYFWQRRNAPYIASLPWIIAVPAALCLYAVGSTVWSHAYLGTVEAIRYFIWAILIFLVCDIAKSQREHLPKLLWGVHWGGLAVSFIGVMQFWLDVQWFAQGPNPASNFVNRNFAAEYVVMTLPISAYLIWREPKLWRVALLTLGCALGVVFLMQTGTRSALLALALVLPLLAIAAISLRSANGAYIHSKSGAAVIATAFFAIVAGLAVLPTNNKALKTEFASSQHSSTAIGRAVFRYGSIKTTDASLSVRSRMWSQTFRMFNDKPIFGVGAGAWEVNVPKYQPPNEDRELDYYAHNEYLQMLAEYGLLGLLSLVLVLVFFLAHAWNTFLHIFRRRGSTTGIVQPQPTLSAPQKAILGSYETDGLIICCLASLAALSVTSLAGFPLHLAACGAMFAVMAGCIAGISYGDRAITQKTAKFQISVASGRWLAAISVLGVIAAAHISNEARLAEQYISRAISYATAINYAAPKEMQATMQATHRAAVDNIKLGIEKNPHYRKMTFLVADKLAVIQDWNNAATVYDSLIVSRPYVPQLLQNAAIVHERLGNYTKQLEYAERALKLRPALVAARSLELHALLALNRPLDALGRGRGYLTDGQLDDVGAVAVFRAAVATQDFKYALEVLALRMERFPATKVDSLLSTGSIQFKNFNNTEAAMAAFKQAWALSDKGTAVVAAIPPELLPKVKAP